MGFEIIWTNRSKKDLKLIDKQIALRIIDKVEELRGRDIVFLEKVTGKDFYKLRIGQYRALIDKHPATKKLFILKVGHRKKIYKNI
ncbi:MAG: type II toxin-antitoxin system RelE/ParE family toxin [Candidatus ainarchaeum sp.]|nr:type II toxin-antitoxin system RelE/ParE family toxin [Candidatus ainarchaeum sp.]